METNAKVPAKEKAITLKRRPKHLSRAFGRLSATGEQLVLVASDDIKSTRKFGEVLEVDVLHPSEEAELQALLQELAAAFDAVHDATQETIAAADRNLTHLEQCTRGLQSTLKILLASNELARVATETEIIA